MSLSVISTHSLNTSRGDDSTISLGSLCHCLTALSENFFLISNQNLPWCSLRILPLVLSLVIWEITCLQVWQMFALAVNKRLQIQFYGKEFMLTLKIGSFFFTVPRPRETKLHCQMQKNIFALLLCIIELHWELLGH